MLSVVLPVRSEDPALLETLAALVPAVADGLVRDVRLVAPERSRFLETVADGAGCDLAVGAGGRSAMLAAAAGLCRCAWVLVLEPGLVPLGAWAEEAADFAGGARPTEAAGFRLRPRRGGRLRALAINAAGQFLGRSHPDLGWLGPREALAAGRTAGPFSLLASVIQDRRSRS